MSALTGLVSIVLFLPCIFKEFSTQNKTATDGNAEEDTTETLNIAEAEAINKSSNSRPPTSIKGLTLTILIITMHEVHHFIIHLQISAF